MGVANEREFFRVIEDPRPRDFDLALTLFHELFAGYRAILCSLVNSFEQDKVASAEIVDETKERAYRGLHLLLGGHKLTNDGGPPPARTGTLHAEFGFRSWLRLIAKDVRRNRRRRMSDTIQEERVDVSGTGEPGKETRTRPFVFVPIEEEADRLCCDGATGSFPASDSGGDWRWQRIVEALPLLSERGRLGTFAILCRSGLPGDLGLDVAGVRGRAELSGILTDELDLRIAAEPLSGKTARLAHEQIARLLGISVATSRRLYVGAHVELRAAVARQLAADEAA